MITKDLPQPCSDKWNCMNFQQIEAVDVFMYYKYYYCETCGQRGNLDYEELNETQTLRPYRSRL
jgi:hypothetical protein